MTDFSIPCGNSRFCEYKSVRFIRVRDPLLVLIYWVLLFAVLLYVTLYTIWIEKGYQSFESVIGSTSTKVKGTSWVNSTSSINGDWSQVQVYDSNDIIIPSIEENALFITTAQIVTANQTRGLCLGNSDTGNCSVTDNCPSYGTPDPNSQGIFSGNCSSNGFCAVYGWCPLEIDNQNEEIFENIGAFTIFVKVVTRWPTFRKSRMNTLNVNGDGSPKDGYNLFSVDEILGNATNGEITSVNDISEKGIIILARSDWDCNFDRSIKHCNPKWKFSRIDGESDSISNGFNFRTVDYDVTGTIRRLRKLYGIRIIFVTSGVGGEFSIAALTLTFGAGLAYLSVASLVADLLLEYILPGRKYYNKAKMRTITHKQTSASTLEHNPLISEQDRRAMEDNEGDENDYEPSFLDSRLSIGSFSITDRTGNQGTTNRGILRASNYDSYQVNHNAITPKGR